jgi:SAM-dependent methyltransferase
VVPGQVNADLWNEHFSRYAFARRYAAGRTVLDAGCGTGYGSAELAQDAARVIGIDLAPDAAAHAHATYPLPNLTFAAASCTQLPFPNRHFDLIVAFEVIEHLTAYRDFIQEAARVLTPTGVAIISTPNKKYYAESRAQTGPNPFHEHEFEAEEFHRELTQAFPHVELLLQNRVESFAFHPWKSFTTPDARIDAGGGTLEDAHFFIAICSHAPLATPASFSYVPKAANILREREQHVQLLEQQLDQTKRWHQQTSQERDDLLALYRRQKQELEEHNHWAAQLNMQLADRSARVLELQDELAREQASAAQTVAAYEQKLQQLDAENVAKTQWAQDTEARLTAEIADRDAQLAECLRLLHESEATVAERTLWAQTTDAERERLTAQLNGARASRWLRLGRRLGIGPAI